MLLLHDNKWKKCAISVVFLIYLSCEINSEKQLLYSGLSVSCIMVLVITSNQAVLCTCNTVLIIVHFSFLQIVILGKSFHFFSKKTSLPIKVCTTNISGSVIIATIIITIIESSNLKLLTKFCL